MDNIVVFVSPDFEATVFQKIADSFRIQQIKTTNDIQKATIVIKPHDQQQNLTIAILAEKILEDTEHELDKIKEQFYKNPTGLKTQKNQSTKFILNPTIQQLNKIKQIHKQKIFNRTKHK